MNQHAAVHVQRDTGAVRRERAGQKNACPCDVVSTAQAGQRHRLCNLGFLFFGELALDDVCTNQTGGSPTAHREAETAKAHRG